MISSFSCPKLSIAAFRRRGVALAVTCALVGAATAAARADSEIAVAVRYLTPTGTSHAHIYLYREDGKLLRQLTNDDSGQDKNPQFAPDGETIVFTRTKPKAGQEFWSVRPRGGGLARLASAPSWYTGKPDSELFTDNEPRSSDFSAPTPPTYRSPDGAVDLVLRTIPDDPDKDIDGPGRGKRYLLHDPKTNHDVEFGTLPGFLGAYDILHDSKDPKKNFLMEKGLRLAFFSLHLDSTDGDTVFALDLTKRRFVRLSPNWAAPFPLPGEPAFLTDTEVRYVPIAGSSKTANCSYVEHWDSSLHKLRYAHPGAAITYGASMYRPGRTPAIVTMHSGASD